MKDTETIYNVTPAQAEGSGVGFLTCRPQIYRKLTSTRHSLNWFLFQYLWANSKGCLVIIFKRRHQSSDFQTQGLNEQIHLLTVPRGTLSPCSQHCLTSFWSEIMLRYVLRPIPGVAQMPVFRDAFLNPQSLNPKGTLVCYRRGNWSLGQ